LQPAIASFIHSTEDSVISMCLGRVGGRQGRAIVASLALTAFSATPAMAQAPAAADPNPGALTFSGAYDIPTIYMFRGIRQETDPGFTSWPYADLKIDFHPGNAFTLPTELNPPLKPQRPEIS